MTCSAIKRDTYVKPRTYCIIVREFKNLSHDFVTEFNWLYKYNWRGRGAVIVSAYPRGKLNWKRSCCAQSFCKLTCFAAIRCLSYTHILCRVWCNKYVSVGEQTKRRKSQYWPLYTLRCFKQWCEVYEFVYTIPTYVNNKISRQINHRSSWRKFIQCLYEVGYLIQNIFEQALQA